MEIPSEKELRNMEYWDVYHLAEDLGIDGLYGLTRGAIVDLILEHPEKSDEIIPVTEEIDETDTIDEELEELRNSVRFNNVVYDPNVETYTAHLTIGESEQPVSILLPAIELREDEFYDSVPEEIDIKTNEPIERTSGDVVRWQILQDIEATMKQHSMWESCVIV